MSISPQGYQYGAAPTPKHPFWEKTPVADANITATATVDANTGTPEVEVTKTIDANGDINFDFAFQNLKGETGATGAKGDQGETGPQGATGATGATPLITASANIRSTTGTPTVTVETDGTPEDRLITFNFAGLKGETGQTGATGPQGPQGEKGDKGEAGSAGNITASATVDANTGTPSVQVTKSGTNDEPHFTFAFSNLKGATGSQGPQGIQGIQGETGPQGATGATGVTPDITATATVDANTGTPSVEVTKSGTSTDPVLSFAFHNLKGESGGLSIEPEAGKVIGSVDGEDFENIGIGTYTRAEVAAASNGDGTGAVIAGYNKEILLPANPFGIAKRIRTYGDPVFIPPIRTVNNAEAFWDLGFTGLNMCVPSFNIYRSELSPVQKIPLNAFDVYNNGSVVTFSGKSLMVTQLAGDNSYKLPFISLGFDVTLNTSLSKVKGSESAGTSPYINFTNGQTILFEKMTRVNYATINNKDYYQVVFVPTDNDTISVTMSLADYSGEITLANVLSAILTEYPTSRHLYRETGNAYFARVENAAAAILLQVFPDMKILGGEEWEPTILNSITEAGSYRLAHHAEQIAPDYVKYTALKFFKYTASETPAQEVYHVNGGYPSVEIEITVTA